MNPIIHHTSRKALYRASTKEPSPYAKIKRNGKKKLSTLDGNFVLMVTSTRTRLQGDYIYFVCQKVYPKKSNE
jgi:hypothetical protein